jgi:PAS domain S-box-containing protein
MDKAYTVILIVSLFITLLFSLAYLTRKLWLSRKELKNSEERFRSIAQNANCAIITIDSKRKVVFWNKKAEEIYGYSADEMIGKPLAAIMPERFREVHQRGFDQTVSTGRSNIVGESIDVNGLRKDGSEFFAELSLSSWTTREGTFFTGIMNDITERKRTEEALKQNLERSRKTVEKTIRLFVSAVEKENPYIAGHHQGVAYLASAIAQEMGLSENQSEVLCMAGTLHDIGYIYIPGNLLSKPDRLTESEFEIIKTHPQIGYEVLKTIRSLQPVAQVVLQHHERMDGSGYPSGLSGESILLEARVITVADVVESMVFPRPYRPALGIDKALGEITQQKGVFYDPEVVDACLRLFQDKGFTFEGKNLYLLFNPLYFVLLNYLLKGTRLSS